MAGKRTFRIVGEKHYCPCNRPFCSVSFVSMRTARVHEVFASIQGEGPWVGERQIFVRFSGCDIRCRYCDTGEASVHTTKDQISPYCSVQIGIESLDRESVPNPLSSSQLSTYCTRLIAPGPSRPTISLTGGEPLLQIDFLEEWLTEVGSRFRIYLETSGIQYEHMRRIRDLVDVVSLDFKLPSATGLRPFWKEHDAFLSAAKGKMLYVKAVVTNDTTMEDLMAAAHVLSRFDSRTIFVLQPAGAPFSPASPLLVAMQTAALGLLEEVRVIPQVHAMLQVP